MFDFKDEDIIQRLLSLVDKVEINIMQASEKLNEIERAAHNMEGKYAKKIAELEERVKALEQELE